MNIPENILQQVADAAFAAPIESRINTRPYTLAWPEEAFARRSVIQHALDNPALTPWLNVPQAWPPVGEYMDEEIQKAWRDTNLNRPDLNPFSSKWVNAFLAALPRCESPALADPEPAAQVPLGPEDVPPGSVFRNAEVCWYNVKYVLDNCVCIDINGRNTLYYQDLKTERWQINTSIPDTGRWDENAWRPCSKPAGKEVAK